MDRQDIGKEGKREARANVRQRKDKEGKMKRQGKCKKEDAQA